MDCSGLIATHAVAVAGGVGEADANAEKLETLSEHFLGLPPNWG